MWSDNEAEHDLLGFQHLTGAVCSIIRNDALLPATIGVFGDWGSGKSSHHSSKVVVICECQSHQTLCVSVVSCTDSHRPP